MNPAGKRAVRKEYLLLQGFGFRYHTHQYFTRKGKVYHFRYESAYLLLPDGKVLEVN